MPSCCWLRSKPMANRAAQIPSNSRNGTNAQPNADPQPMTSSTSCATNSGPTPSKNIFPASLSKPNPTTTPKNATTPSNQPSFSVLNDPEGPNSRDRHLACRVEAHFSEKLDRLEVALQKLSF